jgi:hypothetical protein
MVNFWKELRSNRLLDSDWFTPPVLESTEKWRRDEWWLSVWESRRPPWFPPHLALGTFKFCLEEVEDRSSAGWFWDCCCEDLGVRCFNSLSMDSLPVKIRMPYSRFYFWSSILCTH